MRQSINPSDPSDQPGLSVAEGVDMPLHVWLKWL